MLTFSGLSDTRLASICIVILSLLISASISLFISASCIASFLCDSFSASFMNFSCLLKILA